jgi:hypothetical protein
MIQCHVDFNAPLASADPGGGGPGGPDPHFSGAQNVLFIINRNCTISSVVCQIVPPRYAVLIQQQHFPK